jgi:transglutaminase-like putative cysteine protease
MEPRMILEVQHETRLTYSVPVTEWLAELRVEPPSDAGQSCQSFFLGVSRPVQLFQYQDGFGNRVHHFNLLAANAEMRALAASVVVTHAPRYDLVGSSSTWPIPPESLPIETLDFISLRGPVSDSPRLRALVETLRPPPGSRIADLILGVCRFIHERFQYARAVTRATSPIDDVLATGKGVCQDFAHLAIGLLRLLDVPARYVSGYIHRPGKESQSHAWCEAWLPDRGWIAFDPTNNSVIDEKFVKVAIGRDFTDVAPNKGIYRGHGVETIHARVMTRELESLPNVSWREQLPPLDGPMTAVYEHFREIPDDSAEAEQQQQQQQ